MEHDHSVLTLGDSQRRFKDLIEKNGFKITDDNHIVVRSFDPVA